MLGSSDDTPRMKWATIECNEQTLSVPDTGPAKHSRLQCDATGKRSHYKERQGAYSRWPAITVAHTCLSTQQCIMLQSITGRAI